MKAAPDTEPDRLVQDSIDVELLMLCGARWITVRPDQSVWLAVADAVGCRVRLVNQIMNSWKRRRRNPEDVINTFG